MHSAAKKFQKLQICTFIFQTKIEAKQISLMEIFIDHLKVNKRSFKMMCNLLENNNYISCNSNLKIENVLVSI